MPFSDLLDYLDTLPILPIRLSRDVLPKVEQLTGVRHLVYPWELDPRVARGLMVRYADDTDPAKSVAWIIFAQDLNLCWSRMVQCKEIMHAFDHPDALTDTDQKFAQLLSELAVEPAPEKRSEMHKTEARAFWMALATLCPKNKRDKYRPLLESRSLTPYEVAVKFRIPEVYVRYVFSPTFDAVVAALRTY